MKVAFFDSHKFDRTSFLDADPDGLFNFEFHETKLEYKTRFLAKDCKVVCCFVNDKLDQKCLTALKDLGVELIALRCAGFNNVDLDAAHRLNLNVARVPAYSPHAVAEYAVGMMLCLSRKYHKSYLRVREHNFSLDGLVGFDFFAKTIGIIGTGKIGTLVAEIMLAFGCKVLATDPVENNNLVNKGVSYVSLETLLQSSDVLSLHVPLTPKTHHLLGSQQFDLMKPGAFLINTGRGALLDSVSLIKALKSEKLGGAALDVYEEEEDVFFRDVSDQVLHDDVLARLLTFPNVLISSHQAFLTKEALGQIAMITLNNIRNYLDTGTVSDEFRL